MLRIRTQRGMIDLAGIEANELRERLRRVPSAQPAEETIAVSANASTSVTFTPSTGISAGAPVVSNGGQTVTVSVTLTGATPTGVVTVSVVTPGGTTPVLPAATYFEVIP